MLATPWWVLAACTRLNADVSPVDFTITLFAACTDNCSVVSPIYLKLMALLH